MRQHANMVTKAAFVQFNLSPLAIHSWADQYLERYRDCGRPAPDSLQPHLLLCRAIELEFKAWHRQGTKQRPLKDAFRHDLIASYGALPAKHRILSTDEVDLLVRANEIYAKQKFERIGRPRAGDGFSARLNLAGLEALAKKLMERGNRMDLAQGT